MERLGAEEALERGLVREARARVVDVADQRLVEDLALARA